MKKTILNYPFWLIELAICLASVLVSLIAVPFIIHAQDDSVLGTVFMVVIPTIFISVVVSAPIVYSYRKIVSENVEMIDKLQKDPLTGLLNRHTFIPRYEKLVEELSINQKSIALIMFDLDDFKKINDTYGHMAGDLVIFDACKKITDSVRSTDLVCRFGGEEFLIVLWDISFQQAEMLGNRLLHHLRSAIEYGEHHITYTASLGLVYYKTCTLKADELIHEADLRMYQAKSEGKNKMISYFEE
jgi:diguanylate cyclase (GGDEF)-like protein